MTSENWSASFTARVIRTMRGARQAAGLTMSGLAQGCADRGHPEITEQTVKNLETGRRTSMTVADFVVLADVLGVPPVTLLFPLGDESTVEFLPGREVSTWDAVAWFTGEARLEEPAIQGTARDTLDLFRAHADLVAAATASNALAKERRREAGTTLDRTRRAVLLERAAGYEEHAFEDCSDLRAFRARMRERDLVPPSLPDELAFIDRSESSDDEADSQG